MSKLGDWLLLKTGFRRIAYVNYEPPSRLIKETAPDVWFKPKGVIKTEMVLTFSLAARLRLLLSGKVQMVTVLWTHEQFEVAGDSVQWVVLPPMDKIEPGMAVPDYRI